MRLLEKLFPVEFRGAKKECSAYCTLPTAPVGSIHLPFQLTVGLLAETSGESSSDTDGN